MTEPLELPSPKPLTLDDIQRVIGGLYLEVDGLRRQIQVLQAYIQTQARNEVSTPH